MGAAAFARSLAQEWPDALVKSIDVDLALGADVLARELVDELLSSNRAPEVGFAREGRVIATLLPTGEGGRRPDEGTPLDATSVILVTGGAKGLGLNLATALAKRFHCTVALAGRTAAGDESAKAVAR